MGHSDWVTSIVSGHKIKDKSDSNLLVSGSRDRSLIIWSLDQDVKEDSEYFGQPWKSLTGHDHFVSDISLSSKESALPAWLFPRGQPVCSVDFMG